jgi:SAM-dependent methyltransferase
MVRAVQGMDSGPPLAFSLGREEMRRAWRELRGPGTTPARFGAAVFLGLFIGALPLYGGGAAIVALASLWFGLDAVPAWIVSSAVAAMGWTTSIPLRVALLAAGLLLASFATLLFRRQRPPYRLPENAPPWVQAVERVARRYGIPTSARPLDRARFHLVRGKLLGDPAARLVLELAGEGRATLGSVLDLGSGRGQLALFLLELGSATNVRGTDWDAGKVEQAIRAADAHEGDDPPVSALSATFTRADLREAPLSPADTVLLVDVLHYFPPAQQALILDRAAAAVLPGGRIFVREADVGRGLRSSLTWLEERLFTALRYNRGERVHFRPASEIVRRLQRAGLECEIHEAWGGTPFSNVLVVGARPD